MSTHAPMARKPRSRSGRGYRFLNALLYAAGNALEKIQMKLGEAEDTHISGKLVLTIQIEEDELDGGFVAECLELPGCMSQGETEDEALRNIIDAITGVLETRMQRYIETADLTPSEANGEPSQPRRRLEISVTP